jgi:hypothetical protein
MRQIVAKELRKLSLHRWNVLSLEYKQVITPRAMYKDTKREYMKEQKAGLTGRG